MPLLLELLLVGCLLVAVSTAQCPTGCSCGPGNTRLTCSGSGHTEVPNFSADIRQTATDINLETNFITSIRTTDFQRFVSLERLDLSGNRIDSIEEGSFSTNTALDTLDLSNNNLRETPDNLFESTSIFSLNLRGNLIGNVTAQTFAGVIPGASIRLQDNVLRTIPEDTFSSVGNLHELSLSGNPLRCDCELRWFPSFRDSSIGAISAIGTCDVPTNLNGAELRDLSEDDFLCDCAPSCVNGTCNMTVGECECDDGYTGETCDTSCPVGSFGAGCEQNCTCVPEQESSPCDNVDGTCSCLPGYTGPSCDQECPDGFYGLDCLDTCQCVNGECDFITGFCNCSIGYVGAACNRICPPLRYGQGCSEMCTCETGNCHHITGNCSCPVGYYGSNCDHNCTEAADCVDIGRDECSLETPEQTCGECLSGYVGQTGDGNSECIMCSGAPNCTAINRGDCSTVANTCGPCFRRHLTTPGHEGFSNERCFDPCIDGVMNYDETDIDCGGSLCPPCSINQICTRAEDCGDLTVCLGFYTHPSGLDFPFNTQNLNNCVGEEEPGNAIAERFINALRGREDPLPDIARNPDFTLQTLETSVDREIQDSLGILTISLWHSNFSDDKQVREPLESIAISDLNQAQGDPLYQASIKFTEGTAEESVDQMIENMHSGKLRGTFLVNRKDREVLHNL